MKSKIITIAIITFSLVISLFLYFIVNNKKIFVTGKIIDITNTSAYKSSSLIIENEKGPISIEFNTPINLEYKNISLSDNVEVKTDGIMRETYPPITNGYSIDLINKKYKTKLTTNIYFISLPYYEEIEFNYYKFNTKIFDNDETFEEFKKNIKLEFDSKDIFKDNAIIVSYGNINSYYGLECENIYYDDKEIYIQLKTSEENSISNLQNLRGIILIINKDLIKDKKISTLTKHTKTEN